VLDHLIGSQQGRSVLSSRRYLAIMLGVAAGVAAGSLLPAGGLDIIDICAGENGHG
jgi:hypothetical protein